MLSILKVSTEEQAKLLGVSIGESVLVVPVSQIMSSLKTTDNPVKVSGSTDLSNPNLQLTTYSNLTTNERLIVNALKVLGKAGRGEVMDKTRLTPAAWTTAINSLKETKLVTQTGDRRSAQYFLEDSKPKGKEESKEVKPSVDANKMIEELERSLSSDVPPQTEPELEQKPVSNAPTLSSADVDEEVDEVPDPDEESTPKVLKDAFESLGNSQVEW